MEDCWGEALAVGVGGGRCFGGRIEAVWNGCLAVETAGPNDKRTASSHRNQRRR